MLRKVEKISPCVECEDYTLYGCRKYGHMREEFCSKLREPE